MKAVSFLTGVLVFATAPAWAQQPIPQTDPRINGPLIQSLQAQINLYEAIIKAQKDDAAKREAEWAEYSKSLWQQQSVSEAK